MYGLHPDRFIKGVVVYIGVVSCVEGGGGRSGDAGVDLLSLWWWSLCL